MSLATEVEDLATAVATAVKADRMKINGNAADLSALQTTVKTDLVSALNEVVGSVGGAAGIDDATTSTTSTWSSSKTSQELTGKAAAVHTHGLADLPVAASGVSSASALVRADDSRLTDSRTPTAHTHPTSAITGLDSALAGKAAASHSHATSDVTGLDSALAGKAAAVHTHGTGDVTGLQAYVDGRIGTVLDTAGAPTALDTLNELAAAIGDDANFAGTVTAALGNRLRVDAAQSLTTTAQAQGRANLGAASAADVGNTSTNFVATFEAALA